MTENARNRTPAETILGIARELKQIAGKANSVTISTSLLDLIETLSAVGQIADFGAAGPWVRASERMPEYGMRVLIRVPFGDGGATEIGFWDPVDRIWWADTRSLRPLKQVIAWAPLIPPRLVFKHDPGQREHSPECNALRHTGKEFECTCGADPY